MKFLKDECGQSMVEYALIIALVAIIVIAAVALVGSRTKKTLNTVVEEGLTD